MWRGGPELGAAKQVVLLVDGPPGAHLPIAALPNRLQKSRDRLRDALSRGQNSRDGGLRRKTRRNAIPFGSVAIRLDGHLRQVSGNRQKEKRLSRGLARPA